MSTSKLLPLARVALHSIRAALAASDAGLGALLPDLLRAAFDAADEAADFEGAADEPGADALRAALDHAWQVGYAADFGFQANGGRFVPDFPDAVRAAEALDAALAAYRTPLAVLVA